MDQTDRYLLLLLTASQVFKTLTFGLEKGIHWHTGNKAASGKVNLTAGAYPGFCSIKRPWPGVFSLPPGWDARP